MATERLPGEWVSPITSELITSATKGLRGPSFSPSGDLLWLEGRPAEKGRQVLVRRPAGGGPAADVTPAPDSGLNVRTRVQEYGGGEYTVGKDALYFSNFADQRLYVQKLPADAGGAPSSPKPLTAADSKQRFADGDVDAARNRLLCVVEDHSGEGEAVTTVGAVDLSTGAVTTLVSGSDFYACPRISPDGTKLAWICWNHPNMPWDDTELWVADVAPDGSLSNHSKVAGGKGESVVLPQWGADGSLYFVSDAPDGWWNLYVRRGAGKVEAVLPMAAEFAAPMWVFGQRPYHVLGSGHILAVYSDPKKAGSTLALVDPTSRAVTELATPFTSYSGPTLAVHEAADGSIKVAAAAGSALQPLAVVLLEAGSLEALAGSRPKDWQVVEPSATTQVDEGYLSEPTAVEFPTEGGLTAFMNYYPPKNKDFVAPPGALPPLLVKIHGGPTSQASTAFNLGVQYWTSRGFAVADVNYGGSTGYGRAFRQRLSGSWGVVDVADCCNAARHLAQRGLADPAKLCIDGGSAGGYTTLACLAFRDVFSAGASHYGVADLELLAHDTHKFESRYLDGLIGPYPQSKAVYEQRSPIHALDGFTKPVAFFQGLEDQVVPPNQAEKMFEALKARGVPTALVLFEGEQHGFRQAPNIRRALDGELYFYGRALGFDPQMPADFQPIDIVNAAGSAGQ